MTPDMLEPLDNCVRNRSPWGRLLSVRTEMGQVRSEWALAAARLTGLWHLTKHGCVRKLSLRIRRSIAVARVQSSSLISNTCCTTLLMQGAPPCTASTPT